MKSSPSGLRPSFATIDGQAVFHPRGALGPAYPVCSLRQAEIREALGAWRPVACAVVIAGVALCILGTSALALFLAALLVGGGLLYAAVMRSQLHRLIAELEQASDTPLPAETPA